MLTKANQSKINMDVSETKEQIKIELMGNLDNEGNYTNTDVVNAVKKIIGKDIEEKAENVTTAKGNVVDLSDLWVREKLKGYYLYVNGELVQWESYEGGTTGHEGETVLYGEFVEGICSEKPEEWSFSMDSHAFPWFLYGPGGQTWSCYTNEYMPPCGSSLDSPLRVPGY